MGYDDRLRPPCTYLCRPGSPYLNKQKYGDKATARYWHREQAIKFFMALANAPIPKIAIENPIEHNEQYMAQARHRKYNPYQFGDPHNKETCLWLKGLPPLEPTNIVEPLGYRKFNGSHAMPEWYTRVSYMPAAQRSKIRSKTWPGIARAMAQQWAPPANKTGGISKMTTKQETLAIVTRS